VESETYDMFYEKLRLSAKQEGFIEGYNAALEWVESLLEYNRSQPSSMGTSGRNALGEIQLIVSSSRKEIQDQWRVN